MFVGDTQETAQKATSFIDSIAKVIASVKGGTKQIKADLSKNISAEVAPAAARATAIAAIVGSAAMLGMVLLVMKSRKRRG